MAGNKHVEAFRDEIDKKADVVRQNCIQKYGLSVQNYSGGFNGKKLTHNILSFVYLFF